MPHMETNRSHPIQAPISPRALVRSLLFATSLTTMACSSENLIDEANAETQDTTIETVKEPQNKHNTAKKRARRKARAMKAREIRKAKALKELPEPPTDIPAQEVEQKKTVGRTTDFAELPAPEGL